MATLFNTRISDTYQGLIKTLDNGVLGAALTQLSDGSGNGTGVFLNTSGDLEATGIVSFGSLKDIGENITISKFVDAADGLINNDNDTTMPTSAAIIDYVAGQVTLSDLDFSGDGGSTGSVDLDSQVFNVLGTANQITTSGSGQTLTIGLPTNVTIGTLTATTFFGDLSGTINTATTAVTQPLGDNSTKIATTAFVDRVITAQDLDFQGSTGSGSVDLDSQTFTIQGTTNEITTAATGQVLTVGLPSSITTDLVGNVTGNVTGNLTGDVTGDLTGNVVGNLTGNTTGLHTGNVVGNVTGDLSGDVTGNVTGNVVGNVTGDLTGNADTATAWANGRTITLTGEATGITPSIDGTTSVSAALTLTNSAVIGKVLTGLQSPAGATILATDSMLLAFGKLQSQINGIAEGLQFQGSWNASTNTPTLTSGVGTQGHYYIVSVAGSTNLDGITDWEVGDWAIYSTTSVWQRLDQTGVQGTGTTGNLTKWATGSTISDSIVSESGTALTVTGSLTTTLATTVSGNLTVGTDSLIVNSVSDAVSMAGILTVASPVINTGISGSAVLDDDTFATANATTVATTESIKAYIDSNTGSGTAGTIPKFATGGESLEDSIITESASAITVSGDVKVNEVNPLIFVDSTSTNKASGIITSESGTNKWAIGTNFGSSDNSFNIYNYTAESRYLTITSGGNVGIGMSPSKLLDLQATDNLAIRLYNSTTFKAGIEVATTDGDMIATSVVNDLAIRSQSNMLFSTGGNTERMRITSGGNVGIGGITNPTYRIEANTTSGGNGIKILRGAESMFEEFQSTAGVVSLAASGPSGSFSFRTGTTVGTTTPKLTISSGGDMFNNFNVMASANASYRQSFWGGVSFMYRNDEDFYINSNHTFNAANQNIATYNGSGIGRLEIVGSALSWKTHIGTVVAGTSYSLSSNPFSISNSGVTTLFANIGSGLSSGQLFLKTDGSATTSGLTFINGANTNSFNDLAGISSYIDSGNAKGNLKFWTRNSDGNNNDVQARLTITSEGNFGIGFSGYGSYRVVIRGASSTSSDYAFRTENAGTFGMLQNRNDGLFQTGDAPQSPYSRTTANSANTHVASNGALERSTASSKRFKDNITEWNESGLNTILALKPKTFTYKKEHYFKPDRQFLGLIAEEVANVSGYLADYENEDGSGQIENVRYANIVVPLIKAIQEQQTIIDTLTSRLDVLEKKA